MAINELLDKHNIKYEKIKAEKGISLFRVGNINVFSVSYTHLRAHET